jgi:hypothetical protein
LGEVCCRMAASPAVESKTATRLILVSGMFGMR